MYILLLPININDARNNVYAQHIHAYISIDIRIHDYMHSYCNIWYEKDTINGFPILTFGAILLFIYTCNIKEMQKIQKISTFWPVLFVLFLLFLLLHMWCVAVFSSLYIKSHAANILLLNLWFMMTFFHVLTPDLPLHIKLCFRLVILVWIVVNRTWSLLKDSEVMLLESHSRSLWKIEWTYGSSANGNGMA